MSLGKLCLSEDMDSGNVPGYIEKMLNTNAEYWKDDDGYFQGSTWIYVFHGLSRALEDIIREDIVAKGLQAQEKMPITSVAYGEGSPFLDEVDSSFGIKNTAHLMYSKCKSKISKVRTWLAAKYFARATYQKKDKLFKIMYRGIACGDAIHDEILQKGRFHDETIFDCFEVDRKQYCRYIRNALTVIDQAFEMFQEKKPAYVVTTECIYTKGLFGSVALKLGAEILHVSKEHPDRMVRIHPGKQLFQELKVCDFYRGMIEGYLRENPEWETGEENLFRYKAESSGEDLLVRIGITNQKKNVFIMPHAITDAPRQNYYMNIYRDYNEWFLDTLKIIQEVKNVNWIVKDHPMAPMYQQGTYIKKVFDQNKTENLYWCDPRITGMDIKKVADCVVTCGGEAGLEYWAYGIPTITTAETYYRGLGISYCVKTREEYIHALNHAGELEAPPPASVQRARKYLLALKYLPNSEDGLSRLFLTIRRQELENYRAGMPQIQGKKPLPSHIEKLMDTFCREYIDIMKEQGLKSSTMYRLDHVYDV